MRLRRDGSRIGVTLTNTEAILLFYVSERIVRALAAPDEEEQNRRLLPDAYPEHPRESAEYRRFAREESVRVKTVDARALQDAVRPVATREDDARAGTEIWVSSRDLGSWLRALTSARLVLGSELGLFGNAAHLEARSQDLGEVREVFEWLGYVQDALLNAVEEAGSETTR